MEDQKKSFVLHGSYEDHIELLDMEQRGLLLTAIFRHVNGREPPKMDSAAAMAFSFIKDQLDRDAEKWERIKSVRSAAGKLGGRPKKQTKAKKANANSEKHNVNVNDDVNENENVNVNEGVSINTYKGVFIPPTYEEIEHYCYSHNNCVDLVDPQEFFEYYESIGWTVKGQPMKNWKAAVNSWARRAENADLM